MGDFYMNCRRVKSAKVYAWPQLVLDFSENQCIIHIRGRSSAWLERLPVTQEVASSTLVGPAFFEMPYTVYLLQSTKDKRYYIGQTKNFSLRIAEHNRGCVKSTKQELHGNSSTTKPSHLEKVDHSDIKN
jgi:hypothetical protein